MVLHLAVMWRVLLFNNLVDDASAIPSCATKGVIEKAGKIGKLTLIPTANKMPAPLVWKPSAKSKNESAY